MKALREPIIVLLLALFAALAAGCTSRTASDTSIPWSRPAGWEGQIPGMGQTQGSGNR